MVSKCHGREVREEGKDVAIKRKDAIGKKGKKENQIFLIYHRINVTP